MTIDAGHVFLLVLLAIALGSACYWIGYDNGRKEKKE